MRVGPGGTSSSVSGRGQGLVARRKCASCEHEDPEETVRREPVAGGQRGGLASEGFAARVSGQMRHASQPLPDHAQNFLESRLGAPLDGVRVHANTSAASLAGQINAQAFTLNQDIFFGQGKFRPSTDSGMRLLAHEVTHTLQNREPDVVQKARRSLDDFDPETCEYFGADLELAQAWYSNPKIEKIRHASPGETALLRSGSTGAAVEVLQHALRMWSCEAGFEEFATLTTDGVFGPQTHAAVREFQFAHALQPDGIVGPHTVALLDFETNSPVPSEGDSQMSSRAAQAHDCAAWVRPAIENANARVRRARLKLAGLSGLDDEKVGGDPTIVQPLFERFFGHLTPGRADTLRGTLGTMNQVLTEMVASLGPTASATDWRVLCMDEASTPGVPAATQSQTKTIKISKLHMPAEPAHKESVIIHEAVHAAHDAGDVDIYANLRLFEFLPGQLDGKGGTAAMHNPDSVAGFVMMVDGFDASDALKGRKPAEDDHHVENAEDLEQAKRALAFAESWVFVGKKELERFADSIRDGHINGDTWHYYNGRTQLLLATTAGLVEMKRGVFNQKFCDSQSGPRRFPGLSCPNDSKVPRWKDVDTAMDVRDVVRTLSEIFVEEKVSVFAVGKGSMVRWIPGKQPPALMLGSEFFGENALRVQVVEIIKALAVALGSQPDYATKVVAFLGDHFYRFYGRSLKTI
jgi:hypothetical protein